MMKNNFKGKWIWKSDKIITNDFAYFRKSFDITDEIEYAIVKISAHNYFKLFINGTRVSGEVSPVSSNPFKSKYYLEYDVRDYITKGKNVIGSIVHYLGGSGQNYVNAFPGFILELNIKTVKGDKIIISTDESWKCLKNTPYRNNNKYQQNRRISSIESYDSREESKGWLDYKFDDTNWDKSVISLLNEKVIMKKQYMLEGKVEEEIVPIPIGVQQVGYQVFDTGKILSGWVKITLKGKEGLKIRIRYSEDLENNRVKHNVTNEISENYYDEYIMSDESIQQFKADFSYKAFRYFEITGYDELISENNIAVESVHTELYEKGSFQSSNSLLNDIFKACLQTQKNNILGQMVDCPHREQAQYLADSDLQFETFGYNFLNPEVIEKLLQDFTDVQLKDGTFPFVYPANFEHPDFNIKIPEWDLHFVIIMWKYYWLYGDAKIFDKFYEPAKLMMKHYINRIDDSGLVLKSEYWHISDWPYPEVSQNGRYLTVQNCMFYKCLKTMEKIANINNKVTDVNYFKEKADTLRKAINEKLFDNKRKVYLDSYKDNATSQGANVVALHYGVVKDEKESILKYIIDEGHTCKTLLSIDLLKLLFKNGKSDIAYNLINKDTYPSWGYMIRQGYKTIWEGFDNIESHCHAWNGYVARVMQEFILGVKVIKKGFEEVCIEPYIPKDLEYAEGTVCTIKGDIYVKWQRSGEKVKIFAKIPEDIKGYIVYEDRKVEIIENNQLQVTY